MRLLALHQPLHIAPHTSYAEVCSCGTAHQNHVTNHVMFGSMQSAFSTHRALLWSAERWVPGSLGPGLVFCSVTLYRTTPLGEWLSYHSLVPRFSQQNLIKCAGRTEVGYIFLVLWERCFCMAVNGILEEYLSCFRFCSTGSTVGWEKND